jgi:hypothetical protein
MHALTRRRDREAHAESWHVYYGDVRVGTIGMRAGVPVDADQWAWRCGFYPGTDNHQRQNGTANTFKAARATFQKAWQQLLPMLTEANFQAWRDQRDSTTWKYEMHDCGCRMPTQDPDGRSRFCGGVITVASTAPHVYAAHRGAR